MKPLSCAIVSLLLGCCLLRPAGAGVYIYTAADGSVSLSNVPADTRYRVLITDPQDNVPAKAGGSGKEMQSRPDKQVPYLRIVADAARDYGLDGALLHAVISVESNYNPRAVSSKGAVGLMQLMPATARRYGVADSFDPVQNVEGGARYLRDLLTLFNSDLSLALAAYNAGESAVVRSGNRIPPIRETRDYVPKVLGLYRKFQLDL